MVVPIQIVFCLWIRWVTEGTCEGDFIQHPRPLTIIYILIIITLSFNAQCLEKYTSRSDIIFTYY